MTKITALCWVLVVVALILGGIVGYVFMPAKEKIVEKTIQAPCPQATAVEVVKEVVKEVPLNMRETYLETALDDFRDELNDDDDLVFCKGQEFDEEQVQLKTTPKSFKVSVDRDKTEVSFNVKLKYLDKDVEVKCYKEYAVNILYEEDEKPIIEYIDP